MEALSGWDSLRRLTAGVPRTTAGYSTSLYATREQVEHWCAAGELRILTTADAVLVLRAERDFHRVYHVARDLPALTAVLALLPSGRYVADLIGREDAALEEQCTAYTASGFVKHTFLRRMGRMQAPALLPTDAVVIAGPGDVASVAAFLDRLLDPLSEQLPDITELRIAAREGRLLLVQQDTVLAGMLMYDVQGQLAHLRFWHVDPENHGAGIGRRLMGSFLSRCASARRIVLWVIGDNNRSIAIYRHYGFQTDGLLDHIMVANKD